METSNWATHNQRESRKIPRLAFGLSWLIVLPAGIWAVLNLYLPVFGGELDPLRNGIVTFLVAILALVSLICHVIAHWGAARITQGRAPARLTFLVSGDAAQGWPASPSPWREILSASAGLIANLVLAALAYLVWNALANPILSLCALFACGFNAWLFVINLIPAFPFDGGRLMRVSLRDLVKSGTEVTRAGRQGGMIVAAGLGAWGVFLIAQHSRFSWQTGAITFGLVLLIVDGLRVCAAPDEDGLAEAPRGQYGRPLRLLGAGLLGFLLAAASSSLLLTNNGLEAPGIALPVEPMVNLPAPYRHPHRGELLLTSVLSQAPITAGEWLMAQVDPAYQVVPPEIVVPANTTLQKQAQQDYQMLNDSETTAIAVGLRLAGYSTAVVGRGAQIVAILPGSHAAGRLEAGDIVAAVNGKSIQTTSDLIDQIKVQSPGATVHLTVERGPTRMEIDVPLLPPASAGAPPRLGVEIEPAGFDYRPPFPITIVTQKITGGPSAGLMFSLAVYNLLSPTDLTGGRRIAGTGTIDLDGNVGPIGGVKQKVFAAEAAGATYFLCPVDNYADALSVAKTLRVVKISTAQQAVVYLRSLPPQ
ncbi:MAG: S16 family serine protease [Anaerolineales bacterium]|jgi:PDZ domain-containing protein